MMKETNLTEEAMKNFNLPGIPSSVTPYGNGHINDTFLLTFNKSKIQEISYKDGPNNHMDDDPSPVIDSPTARFILQRMNHDVFKEPILVMENIIRVTTYLKKIIKQNGGEPDRETLTVIPSADGKSYYKDSQKNYWRCYLFIENTICCETVDTPDIFYNIAFTFGRFQKMLANYPAETLHETIRGFHDTKARFEVFKQAVTKDICHRASAVRDEIDFILERESLVSLYDDLRENGELPLRVTHNDTKLNNILIDSSSGKGICVIDLDTVMPGYAINDFGDSIRFGASTAAEDEPDLTKVSCDMELFSAYAKGFIDGCGGSLTRKEIELLPLGAKMMTFECGMRFLTDYLNGDVYFKIHRAHHNLDRCRTQLKLVSDMEEKWHDMNAIIKEIIGTDS